jgi:hypothetical protein
MRDKGYKVDEYDLIFVNFKNLVHRGEMIINEPYVLTSHKLTMYSTSRMTGTKIGLAL